MNNPKVSIIVPIYNVEKYLARCMHSLLNQTLKEIEIIMVDDGSPDNCPQICDEYASKDNRVKVIHKKNAGLGFARNSGLEIASGEYVAFVDSDDFVEKTMYEELYNVITAYNSDAIICSFNKVYKEMITPLPIGGMGETIKKICAKKEYIPNVIGCSSSNARDYLYSYSACIVLYNNHLIKKYNLRFESERVFVSEDILFNLDYMSKANKIVLYPHPLYNYCYNENSLTTKYNPQRFKREVCLYKEIQRRIQTYHIDLPHDIVYRIERLLLYKACYSICDTIKSTTFVKAVSEIKKICTNKILEEVLAHYPIKELPITKQIFYILVKKHMPICLVLLYKLKRLNKKKIAGVSFDFPK